jgi:hypothetical protein
MPWLEPIRMIADFLNGDLEDYQATDQGVNTKLALVPRDAGDAQPADLSVVDSTRDAETALKQLKKAGGVLQVSLYRDSTQGRIATVYRDGVIPIVIGVALDTADPAAANRDESYIVRAVLMSLAEMNRAENANLLRRNRINLMSIEIDGVWPAEGKVGDRDVVSAIRLTAKTRDTKPHGTES